MKYDNGFIEFDDETGIIRVMDGCEWNMEVLTENFGSPSGGLWGAAFDAMYEITEGTEWRFTQLEHVGHMSSCTAFVQTRDVDWDYVDEFAHTCWVWEGAAIQFLAIRLFDRPEIQLMYWNEETGFERNNAK
jgi:hypothetical protein